MDDHPAAEGFQNPLDAVFERAVLPFESAQDLKGSLPWEGSVLIMRKLDDAPRETIHTDDGATVTVPVLGALMESGAAERHPVAAYDFSKLGPDEIAVVFHDRGAGEPELRVVTRGESGALMCADIGAMLDALGKAAGHPAFQVFPGSEFLIEALRTGLMQAKRHIIASLKDAGGTPGSTEGRPRTTAP